MQEINLLQNKVKDRTLQFERSNRLVLTIFTLLVIFEFVAYGGLYFLIKDTKTKSDDVIVENTKIQQEMDSNQNDLALAKGMQAQLKNVNTLLKNHIYWSNFLDAVSKLDPVKVQYLEVDGEVSDGKIDLKGVAPTYADVGRMLLSLTTSDQFSNVKLKSVSPSPTTKAGYSFDLEMKAVSKIFIKQ